MSKTKVIKKVKVKGEERGEIRIEQDKYGTYLNKTVNGYQWSSIPMSEEEFRCTFSIIRSYLRKLDKDR